MQRFQLKSFLFRFSQVRSVRENAVLQQHNRRQLAADVDVFEVCQVAGG